MAVNLGDQVRCRVTGFEGVAAQRSRFISGEDRIGVQPPYQEGKELLKEEYFDESMLEVQVAGAVQPARPAEEVLFNFGDELKDTITDFKGKLTALAFYLNGCVRYYLERPMTPKSEKKPEGSWFDGQRLQLVKAAKPLAAQRRTGGPMDCHPTRDIA